ncbi:MAG: hypothetical protein JXO49_01730 [Deltaproteobacteria bacterium]|nr:hypothetical protein [Candidatus Anaeroferrophillus wilburensis]MBN2888046.1 hypothetical protein [Deltaproteobacteria bacterium]
MDKNSILTHLENLLAQFNIRVVYENLVAQAIKRKRGLCRHENEYLFIINKKENLDFKIGALCEIISKFDLESIYLPPQVRALIERQQKPSSRRQTSGKQ